MPRPWTGRKPITVRLDPDTEEAVAAEVERDGWDSRSELLRWIVRDRYALEVGQ